MNSLRRNTIFAAAGNFSSTAMLAVAILVIAWFGDPELVGRYSYALAICAPIFLLAHLRLRDVKATQVEKAYFLSDYFHISIATNALALILVPTVCWFLALDTETLLVAFLIGLWKVTLGLSDLVYGYHQGKSNLKLVSRLQITHAVASTVLFSLTFIVTRNLPLAVGLLFPLNAVLFVVFDLATVKENLRHLPRSAEAQRNRRLTRLLMSALPLGLGGAIFALNMVIPRGLLEHHFSLAEVGVFAALAFFARAGTPVIQAFGQASSRRLAKAVAEGNSQDFMKIQWQACKIPVALGLTAIVGGWFIGQQVVTGVYGADYLTSRFAIVLIATYATLVYISTVLTYGVIAARRLKSQLVVLSLTVVAVFIGCRLLVPEYGITGACASLAISAVVRIIGNVVINVQAVQAMATTGSNPPANSRKPHKLTTESGT